MTHHEHDETEQEFTEGLADATEEARRQRGQEGASIEDDDTGESGEPLTVEDDEGEDRVSAF